MRFNHTLEACAFGGYNPFYSPESSSTRPGGSGQLLCAVQMVWDRKASYNGQTFVPHSEGGAHRLRECDVKGVEVDGVQSIVESDGAVIIVQQDAHAPEVGRWLDGDFLAVVSHHPVIVAAAQRPRSRVLPNPLVLRGRFVSEANGIPVETKQPQEKRSAALRVRAHSAQWYSGVGHT